jgi:hypothetical protein
VKFTAACTGTGARNVLDLSKQKVSDKQKTCDCIRIRQHRRHILLGELLSAVPPEFLQVWVLPAKKVTRRDCAEGEGGSDLDRRGIVRKDLRSRVF